MVVTAETHYIEEFPHRWRGKDQAICGAWVDPASFSTEPTCPVCQQRCADEDAETARVLEDANRIVSPPPRLNTFDLHDGYTPRDRTRRGHQRSF